MPKEVAIARLEQTAMTMTHGTGLIPNDRAMAIQMGVSIAAVPLLDIKFVNTLVRTAITVVSAITEAFAPPNKFRTKLAISAPPPDTSNPVPRPEIAPIQNSTSHGKSANA